MRKDSDLHIRIEKDLNERFRKHAQITGITQSEYLRAYIRDLIDGQKGKVIHEKTN